MEYYKCEGDLASTYGVHENGTTFMQGYHPNGELGMIHKLEDYDGWNLQRWIGQMGAEKIESSDEIPEPLMDHALSHFRSE